MTLHRPISTGSSVLDDVAQVIGREAAKRLTEALGGTKLYVPKLIARNNPIMLAIGPAASAKLADHYHGTVIDLPKAHARRERALELAKDPDTVIRDVALATDFTERHIYRLLAADKLDSDDGQIDLFEDR